jgi:hypothetical protein
VGLIVAWWREGLGGAMTVSSLLIFYAIHVTTTGTLPSGPGWVLFAMPGFCLYWLRCCRETQANTVAE